jgi:hypothetical protein
VLTPNTQSPSAPRTELPRRTRSKLESPATRSNRSITTTTTTNSSSSSNHHDNASSDSHH